MVIPPDIKKAALVFGIGLVIFWLLKPSSTRKPSSTKESNGADQTKNANIVLKAYTKAVNAGETATALEELNKLMEKEYGMRVYKKPGASSYSVRDVNGKDIKI